MNLLVDATEELILNPELTGPVGEDEDLFKYKLGESLGFWGEKKPMPSARFRAPLNLQKALERKQYGAIPVLQAFEEMAKRAPKEIQTACDLEIMTKFVYFTPLITKLLPSYKAQTFIAIRRIPTLRPDLWKAVVKLVLLHVGDHKSRYTFLKQAFSANVMFPREFLRTQDVAQAPCRGGGQVFFAVHSGELYKYLQLFRVTMERYSVPHYIQGNILKHMLDFIESPGGATSVEATDAAKLLISEGKLEARARF